MCHSTMATRMAQSTAEINFISSRNTFTVSQSEDVCTALVNPRTSFETLLDLGGVVDVSFDRGDEDGPVDRRDQFHLFSEYLYSIVTSSATSVTVDPPDSLRQAMQ